ncbi:peptide deformylase [Mycoplasma miroungirhinis]|uniref:Peptide deformylase n=1 Tax=Mycoplasma miroungirhinis TaxID=754516 RepID=A0A6M4JDU1_9MOLU|nr:peptide deformylase [Mycoplasma miroungirhinis]QJR44209.1 peptide deformylase [Mycoplasma miroungirhinis]
MFKVKLIELPAKVLRQKSKNVAIPLSKEDELLIEKMIYHIDDSQKEGTQFRPGVGVAAVQYGILKNIFYIFLQDENGKIIFKDALINPVMKGHSEALQSLSTGEGCLSVSDSWPNQEGYIKRYNRVIIDAYSYNERKMKRYDASGYLAIVMQHEYDHLQGKLFLDHIDQKDPWHLPKDLKLVG